MWRSIISYRNHLPSHLNPNYVTFQSLKCATKFKSNNMLSGYQSNASSISVEVSAGVPGCRRGTSALRSPTRLHHIPVIGCSLAGAKLSPQSVHRTVTGKNDHNTAVKPGHAHVHVVNDYNNII